MAFTDTIIDTVRSMMNGSSVNKKNNVLVLSQSCMDNINKFVLPGIESIISSVDNIPNNTKLTQLGVDLGLGRDRKAILVGLRDFFTRAETCLHTMSRVINKDFPDLITAKTTSFKVGTVMRVLTDISSMSIFCLDVIYYAISETDKMDKAYLNQITKNYSSFCSLFLTYNKEIENITKNAPAISNEIISLDAPAGMSDILAKKSGAMVRLPDGLKGQQFVNNPIYHIRLWLVDRDIEKYNANKDKKEMLELKVLSLKMAKNDPDANTDKLDKQIAYYEEKISDLNYKIERFEKE